MCRRIKCKVCDKPGWAGCGAHIEAVLGDVPKDERCHCTKAAKQANSGFFARMFGG